MTIEDLKSKGLIILECISGSRAYGLATPASDTDIKGVFILPKEDFYALNYIPQISNSSNDVVYYELGRFMELLMVNNPNILELLASPESSVLIRHPFLQEIDQGPILSKLCEKTFGRFAISQVKKAKGLNKKIVNPMDRERKSVLDFCYVNYEGGSLSVKVYLKRKGMEQENCGLVKIPNMKDVYGLYHSLEFEYRGIIKAQSSNTISLSSVPKGQSEECLMYFNHDGYSSYCKDYKEYWAWVENRNEDRYENTKRQGQNYDSKNMMHTFRLLQMAIEIANEERINVLRKDRPFLLRVKNGEFSYNELVNLAAAKKDEMEKAFANSSLRELPDVDLIRNMTYRIRDKFYNN